jgi:SIR2-like domain
MKKRLLMILGAGSSLECGMPAVNDLNGLMQDWADAAAREMAEPNYYAVIWRALNEHLAHGFESSRVAPNYEMALRDLVALTHWVRPAPEGGALRTLVAGESLPDLGFPNPDAYGPYISIKMHWAHLQRALAAHLRGLSARLETGSASLRSWRCLLDGLRATFDVAIYTLNHDAVAVRCWPGAVTGFDDKGRFDPSAVHARSWEGLFHLHGSVHFSLQDASKQRVVWRDDLAGDFADCDDRVATQRSDGRDFAASVFVAGGFKLDQLLGEPFSSYQSALVRDASRADAIVIGGYGFGDAHVNDAIKNALHRDGSRPRTLVLDHATADTPALAYRQDRWANVLRDALYAGGEFGPPIGVDAAQPVQLGQLGACERSPDHRVALWYGGFLGASAAIERLSGWLAGGADTLLAEQ